jgi:hypothetical protein
MHIIRALVLAGMLVAAPAQALRVTEQAFTTLGVSRAKAQCIVVRLGEGAELDEAGEEPPEGELDSALSEYGKTVGRAVVVANRQFYMNIAARAFANPANRTNFLDIALNKCR